MLLPILERDILNMCKPDDAGNVRDNIDAAVLLDRCVDERSDGLRVGDIAVQHAIRGRDVHRYDVGTLVAEQRRGRGADAGRGPGDQHGPSRQTVHPRSRAGSTGVPPEPQGWSNGQAPW
jgi:hypothetical protein